MNQEPYSSDAADRTIPLLHLLESLSYIDAHNLEFELATTKPQIHAAKKPFDLLLTSNSLRVYADPLAGSVLSLSLLRLLNHRI